MSNYDQKITITLPVALADIASRIGRAMDSDVGGERSFTRIVTSTDAKGLPVYGDTISMTTPCTTAFKAQATYMLANPESLHAAVEADYAVRWVDLVAPTLDECQAFCAGVIPEPIVASTQILL
jgi:hypothetical protein